ncbi:MAG: ABC transporter substrate-binding protein [Spirochaetales bacterium]|nr:ABC transporter substrate-binding protein [Spirochaetales bacterium]
MNFTKLMVALVLVILLFSCTGEDKGEFSFTNYSELEKTAMGSTVSFYMWGGSPQINTWVGDHLGRVLQEKYEITLKMVPLNDASEFINKLATEKLANLESGSADLIWINGENFKNARQADLLYGPYVENLPNFDAFTDSTVGEYDFGFPVQGYEAPYGKAQFVFEWDSASFDTPPASFSELKDWIKANPGRFTYPQPPDFTGSAFLRQLFYETSGGWEQFFEGFDGENIDLELFQKHEQKLWDYLNEIEPFLWQEGRSYPKTITVLETLFSSGEVDFAMYYSPSHASGKILEGEYRESVRTFVMDGNSISNTHFTAIPFNAPNKAGALVVSNLLLSPEVQLSKADPVNWGDLPVVSYQKLSEAQKGEFDELDFGVATLPVSVLSSNSVPEIPSGYVELIENGWEANVLNK